MTQDVRDIVNAPSKHVAEYILKQKIEYWEQKDSKLAQWLERVMPQTMTFYSFDRQHWKRIRTNNLAETYNKELKRRTRVATLFPNIESLLRLATAQAIELSEYWETRKVYLQM